jgi:hypothetical protein
MKAPSIRPARCAIYTRVSTEHGLDSTKSSIHWMPSTMPRQLT